ncbi:MAG: hypothetical protein ACR2GD_02615 [Pyrinomonadaceae bacterium]
MNITFLFGMSEPVGGSEILAYLIVGLIGFAICYVHRYFIFAVMPIFLWLAYYIIFYEHFSRSSTDYLIVYAAVSVDFLAILFSGILSWKKHKNHQKNLLQ